MVINKTILRKICRKQIVTQLLSIAQLLAYEQEMIITCILNISFDLIFRFRLMHLSVNHVFNSLPHMTNVGNHVFRISLTRSQHTVKQYIFSWLLVSDTLERFIVIKTMKRARHTLLLLLHTNASGNIYNSTQKHLCRKEISQDRFKRYRKDRTSTKPNYDIIGILLNLFLC